MSVVGAITVAARHGNQAGGVRAEASDVQRGATFLLQRGIALRRRGTKKTASSGVAHISAMAVRTSVPRQPSREIRNQGISTSVHTAICC